MNYFKPALFTAVILLFTVFSADIIAMGSTESSGYNTELEQEFGKILDDIYSGRTNAQSGRGRLEQLRQKHQVPYTDEAGILDSIIDNAAEGSIEHDEALLQFQLLQDGKLMKHRQAQIINNEKSNSQQSSSESSDTSEQQEQSSESSGSDSSGSDSGSGNGNYNSGNDNGNYNSGNSSNGQGG